MERASKKRQSSENENRCGEKIGMKASSTIALLLAVSLFALLPGQGQALTPGQVFDRVKESIVVVKTLDAQGKLKAQGSGVILSSGRVATSCSVAEGGASYRIGRGRQLFPAALYAKDRGKDICLLDARGIRGKEAEIGKAASLKVGDPVYALSISTGLELSLSNGVIAQLRGRPAPLIRTTAITSPASNGGGLFDAQGRLVGLTTSYTEDGQNLTFAMPAEWIGEVKSCREAAAGDSRHAEWAKRAIALDTKEDWQGMLDWCRKWTKNEPKNSDVWFNLGVAYSRLDRHYDAIAAFRQAVMIDPGCVDAWFGIGVAYEELRRYNGAMEAFRQTVMIDPEYASAWFRLGTACGRLERYSEAVDAFHQALTIDPAYTDAWFGIGIAYFLNGSKTEPMEAVQQLRRLDLAQADRLFSLIMPAMSEQAWERAYR
jgi:Flp pilus assembly protein TadD